jgi:5-oxopent-3-ene-1,2,5-tricarboxylate decarboxylase/2-hydroxyhepta-2,4-diene-1,7-dioate isomerase
MPATIETGTVYVAALNRWATLVALGDALHAEPYRAPPTAPVLQIKPANTWSRAGQSIVCPAGVPALRMGASLAVEIGTRMSRVTEADAPGLIAGYRLANDVSVPYQSHYRPAIKTRCRDGFLPLGPLTEARLIPSPERVEVVVEINGAVKARVTGEDWVRDVWRLLADITQFITFEPGDLVLLGEIAEPPLARAGDLVRVSAEGFPPLDNPIVAEIGDGR